MSQEKYSFDVPDTCMNFQDEDEATDVDTWFGAYRTVSAKLFEGGPGDGPAEVGLLSWQVCTLCRHI